VSRRSIPRAGYLADPTIQSLTSVLQEVQDGLLAFPRFQRPFVWSTDQRLELLRTILRGLPIGTFMTWRTRQTIATFDRVGRWALAPTVHGSMGRQYVLDGLQRLSTLYVALVPDKRTSPKANSDDIDDVRELFVDLSNEDPDVFEGTDLPDDDEVARHSVSISLTDFLASGRLIKRLRQFSDERLVERADRVAERLKSYKVPIVPFVSDELREVTRAFQLVNSQGTQMSPVHMVNALSWTRTFSLLDTIDNLRRGDLAETGWGDIDETVVLRALAAVLGHEAYDLDEAAIAKSLRESHERAVATVESSLLRVASVLRRTCHIRTFDLVPYTPQTLVLVKALSQIDEPDEVQRRLVGDWLWFTTYVEAFSGAVNASMVEGVTQRLRTALDGGQFEWTHRRRTRRPFPPQVDFRHARSRAFALRLAFHRARNEGAPTAYRLLAEEGVRALPNILPPAVAKGAWRFGRGARVVASAAELGALRTRLKGPYDAPTGAKFAIGADAWSAYTHDRFEEFVKVRDAQFEEHEEEHFSAVTRRLFPPGDESLQAGNTAHRRSRR
jgi:hypothetical protein